MFRQLAVPVLSKLLSLQLVREIAERKDSAGGVDSGIMQAWGNPIISKSYKHDREGDDLSTELQNLRLVLQM